MMAWLIENWRDAILIVVGLLAVYVVFSFMRLMQLGRSSARVELDALHEPSVADAPVTPAEPMENAAHVPDMTTAPAPARSLSRLARFAHWGQAEHDALAAPSPSDASPDAAPAAAFVNELRQTHLDAEIEQLRRESGALRDELAALHEELGLLKAARNVSPMYSEAASLAQRGMSADGIAGQCGISLGEAELVAALARADGRGGRIEPTEYHDPADRGDPFATGGNGHGGNAQRNRRTGTHG